MTSLCLAHSSVLKDIGSGRYIYDIAMRFAQDGVLVTLFCFECEPDLRNVPGLKVVQLNRPPDSPIIWRAKYHQTMWALNKQLSLQLKGVHFDAVLGSDLLFLHSIIKILDGRPRFVYAPLSMIAPLEIESYELGGFRHWLAKRLYYKLQRRALRNADCVVRFTRSAVKALEQYYQISIANKALESVYVSREFESETGSSENPIAESFIRPVPRQLLWVGRLVKSKNVSFLIRTVSLLPKSSWVLTICSDGPERKNLEALTAELNLGERVQFLGKVENLAQIYRGASVLLTASLLEQYSLTLMEAYSFGVPCIGLRPDWKSVFNSNEDQIIEGKTGYLVSSEKEMAERISQLLQNEPLRQSMAASAFEMKQANFSFEKYFQHLKAATIP
jgi:glycosyltransferase involved in cell wall biosynthesis